jgi:large subunit ribosomal protein L24
MRSLEVANSMTRRIRKGDLVQVLAGADRGKQGRVIAVDSARGKVRIEKVRMQKRHLKAGRKGARTGGIIEQEGYIDASNVMLVDATSNAPSRVRIRIEGDQKIRTFAKSGDDVPTPASS